MVSIAALPLVRKCSAGCLSACFLLHAPLEHRPVRWAGSNIYIFAVLHLPSATSRARLRFEYLEMAAQAPDSLHPKQTAQDLLLRAQQSLSPGCPPQMSAAAPVPQAAGGPAAAAAAAWRRPWPRVGVCEQRHCSAGPVKCHRVQQAQTLKASGPKAHTAAVFGEEVLLKTERTSRSLRHPGAVHVCPVGRDVHASQHALAPC